MGSTIDASEFQATLDQFEATFGISYEEFAALSEAKQNEILYTKSTDIESADAYTLFDDLYAYYASIASVYEDMQSNGNALEAAQASVLLNDDEFKAEYELSINLSSMWGEQVHKNENDSQRSNGSNINYSLEDPYSGQEVTLNLSESSDTNENWISDPNADDPFMCDTDGDGYKDTTFYMSNRSEFNVVNIQGNTVNIDTDGNGIIDKNDGVDANTKNIPNCEIDLNGASWELVDYDAETNYYRLKITSGTEPDLVESYINVYGPCYIIPINGTPPSETTLRSYSEEAMRSFKQSVSSSSTIGEIMYGVEGGSENMTYILDSNSLSNQLTISPTDDQFEAGATITIDLESGEADNISLDCQNADASFEWHGNDLHMTLTNDKGEEVTYIFKNFETMNTSGDTSAADALHLSNVDISDVQMQNLINMAPGFQEAGYGDSDTIKFEDGYGAHMPSFSLGQAIYIEDSDSETGEISAWDVMFHS